ncbi:hypothetical protein H257_14600 [Aphanomyces astaci]|uniref:glucan endo-1,3-beta-D-glucosidase n=1 Tax=Aphanomyces astaci TaxID=112090 RepID=W4FSY3_APHAT|nr:hypothetical protein H257_14600 [Aphanomyces astaci]ETV69763.1 hypothetical protein H257_14600 [Aphanomyces astaci]|eukprot:XP_009840777.1 hypothetical protein H257_14600 [Aphanomyces astaci]
MAPSTSYPSKHVCLILVVLSSVLSVDAAAGGVCFDVADVGNIDNHFRQIKTKFSAVRVYETQMGNTNAIAAAAKAGLQIAAGVWIRSGDAKIQADIDAVAAGIKAYPGTVVAVYVGNEDLANGVSEQTVINKVNQAKASLSALGVPIGSVQVDGDFLSAGRLADACDVVGVNIYPYFGSSPDSILKPINDLNARWKQVTAKFGGKAKLTETGWPTSGTYNGHVGSYDNAKAYWQSYSDWSYGNGGGVPFYFQHKDMPNKSPEFEANFGLIDSYGNWKFDVAPATPPPTARPTSPPTAPPTEPPTQPPTTQPPTQPPTTQAPTTQPPTTAAPTTTVTPEPTTTTAAPTIAPTTATPEPSVTPTVTPEPTATPEPNVTTTLEPTTTSATTTLVPLNGTNTTSLETVNSTSGDGVGDGVTFNGINGTFDAINETFVTSISDGASNPTGVLIGSAASGADAGGDAAGGGVASGGATSGGAAAGAGSSSSSSATSIGGTDSTNINVSSADSSSSNPAPTIFLTAGGALAVAAAALFVVRRRAQSLEEDKDAFDPEFGLHTPPTALGGYPTQVFTTQANATPVATASTAPGPEQRDPGLFNPKDSLDGVAMLEDRPSTMLDNMGDIRGSEDSLHGAGDDTLASDEPAAFDNRTTMDLLDTARSSTEILL